MVAAGRVGRHGNRDSTIILLSYRHGLRVTELVSLRWEQIDLKQGLMHVNRLKQGTPSVYPIRGPELRALRRLQREYNTSPYVFCSERKGPLSSDAIRKILTRAGKEPSCRLQCTLTCCVTHVVSSLRRPDRTRAPSSIT